MTPFTRVIRSSLFRVSFVQVNRQSIKCVNSLGLNLCPYGQVSLPSFLYRRAAGQGRSSRCFNVRYIFALSGIAMFPEACAPNGPSPPVGNGNLTRT